MCTADRSVDNCRAIRATCAVMSRAQCEGSDLSRDLTIVSRMSNTSRQLVALGDEK